MDANVNIDIVKNIIEEIKIIKAEKISTTNEIPNGDGQLPIFKNKILP